MEWMKTHLSIVIAGAAAVLAVAALVLGVVLPTTAKEMQTDESVLNSLTRLESVNQRMIDQVNREVEDARVKLEANRKQLEATGNREPLVPGVFPKVDASNQTAPYAFKDQFVKKRKALLALLNATDEPNAEEIAREEEELAERRKKEDRDAVLGLDPTTGKPTTRSVVPMQRGAMAPVPGMTRVGLNKAVESMTPAERLREDPLARVSFKKAHAGYCYANLTSLSPAAGIEIAGVPTVDDMWYAQVALWVQEDVLGALAALNKEVAAQLPDAPESQRWVGYLPVKRLVNITVGNYVPPSAGGGAAAGRGGGMMPEPNASFTQRSCSEGVDVLRFMLTLVVEAQSLPAVIDRIGSAGFYTPLMINYQTLSPYTQMQGFIYGSSPIIEVKMEWEGCFLRSKYAKWLPDSVATAIKEGRAGPQLSGGGMPGMPGSMMPGPGGGMMRPGPGGGRGRNPDLPPGT